MVDDELSQKVSQLSTRLIQAIDRQADLEDQVQLLRKELEVSRKRNLSFEDMLSSGELVPKEAFKKQVDRANTAAKAQISAEKESARLQAEIEELTSSLFSEANKMVADANRETSVWGRKNDSLRQQLRERDILLENMQEQLTALKSVLQDVSDDRDRLLKAGSDTNSDPGAGNGFFEVSLNTPIRPALRHDLRLFHEFVLMAPANSLEVPASGRSSPATGSEEGTISSIASRIHTFNSKDTPGIKDFKFFKRSIAEDIEPTLRLDAAPGLNWLSRRNILSSIYDGSIKIEPITAVNESYKLAYSVQHQQKLHRYTHSSQLSQSSIATQATQASQTPSISQQVQVQVPISSQVQSKISCVASTEGKDVYATLVGSPIPSDLSNSISAPPPVATLTPCTMCGEKRSSSLLYARLHNLRADKEKDGRDRSSSVSTPNLALARDYFSSGSSDKSPLTRSNTIGLVNHSSNYTTSPTMSVTSTPITEDDTNHSNGNGSVSREKDDENGYMPLTPSISSSSLSLASTNNHSSFGTPPFTTNNSITTTISNSSNTPGIYVNSMNTPLSSSGYPLCYHCLHRIRAVCDYVSFVRAVRLGVWKTEDASSRHKAWEECVRLKERMFWARQGAGFLDKPMIGKSLFEGDTGSNRSSATNLTINSTNSNINNGNSGTNNNNNNNSLNNGIGGNGIYSFGNPSSSHSSLADIERLRMQKSTDAFYGVSRKSSVSIDTKDFEDAQESTKGKIETDSSDKPPPKDNVKDDTEISEEATAGEAIIDLPESLSGSC